MGGTNDPPERNDDQDDDLKAGEEVSAMSLHLTLDPLLEGLLMDRTPA
jgi:hypothetical protein